MGDKYVRMIKPVGIPVKVGEVYNAQVSCAQAAKE